MSLTNTSFNQIFISHWLNRSTNSIIHLQNEISKEKEICSISMHSHVHSHFAQPFQVCFLFFSFSNQFIEFIRVDPIPHQLHQLPTVMH